MTLAGKKIDHGEWFCLKNDNVNRLRSKWVLTGWGGGGVDELVWHIVCCCSFITSFLSGHSKTGLVIEFIEFSLYKVLRLNF